ncbi:cbb3-type cytochrome oxidase assembly protein CcoS [Roseinatronobacter sp. S2]|uniref:cbb3-type cytochrome oxidase assembly protein CcoS n=1 Tax=Roseinatronobacter sp. S2 TaxID=3035471 RepID=UPI0024105199|nr:cbb3-type cytochrome oxidase assembly protein CcoS [Roseinatronobacter sp. S2]WFE77274.1 cbb3-type cytochrome oxidase assembly protein CcoS [Roseinatronobacter sp. S2]
MGLLGSFAFFWALRSSQFDDPDGNAWRVIASEYTPSQNRPPEKEGKLHDHMAPDPENRDSAGGL